MLLRHGDTGYRVESLQRDLVRAGHNLAIDGWYGDETEAAVRAFQRQHDLIIDGLAGPKTREALHRGKPDPLALRQIDLVLAAEYLGVELAAIMAVNEVESRGSGFHPSGEPVILFERHIMRRRLIHHGIDPVPWQRRQPDIVNDKPGGYVGGIREHRRLDRAHAIHPASAWESASWGAFQIMGFHWQALGYESAEAFVIAMQRDEAAQLDAFVRFIAADRGLHAALRRRDWRDFARRYNGPAFAKNDYDTKLAAAYRRHSQDLEIAA
ncbi:MULTISPECIES: N-acetylmuramidase family protein [unclassified Halomonas]|uniref:N-acetylmuramidase family protein n=1 Tax=unclassified Halomonas TaxID=2609666 RepID=UPI00288859D1|nr:MULTISPECIES: N-acetylmuramidase family protein [unclassified Halomonas]MDT0501914.1 N-acetylmuramidase family protein [Halomonas sp. PAR7]MDT0510997.1 N-acetylmuramidase family protein [Halomonas sp. LES1]MDT0592486.1 N-acetylmuramidase family protein [Halomonas sp. PAR8]